MFVVRHFLSILFFACLLVWGAVFGAGDAYAVEDGVVSMPASLDASGHDLALVQQRSGDCAPGEDCEYLITVTNKGPDRFAGMINILRTVSYRPRRHENPETVTCTRKRASIACRTGRLKLKPGQSFAFTLTLAVPRTANGEVRDCVLLSFRGGEFEDPYEDLVAIIQLALKSRDLYVDGEVDGILGSKLTAAIDTFRQDEELPEGEIDIVLVKGLFGPSGLLADGVNAQNDEMCDTFVLPEPAAVKVRKRPVRRRTIRRVPVQRQARPNVVTPTNAVRPRRNIRLDGFD